MTRTLLIDADILAYRATAANERKYDWGDTGASKVADFAAAKRAAEDELEHLIDKLDATDFIVCLSDDVQNFRKLIYPAYKTNRTGSRPEYLYDLKEWLAEKYPTRMIPRLEADDVMGILSTEPHTGDRIIVSQDKDMQTTPGLLFNPGKDKKVRTVTPEEADRFLLFQTLTGDQTDGYPGCPGCGPKGADAVLNGGRWWRKERMILRGPREGDLAHEWLLEEQADADVWTRVTSAYAKAGLTARHATDQLNLARILRHDEFDGKRPILCIPHKRKWLVN